jgi:hypothetical protein
MELKVNDLKPKTKGSHLAAFLFQVVLHRSQRTGSG